MILKIVDFIIDRQIENEMIYEDDINVYRYGYTLVLEVMINIMTAIIIGLISGELVGIVLFLIIFIPLRSYCGGYHAPKAWICILLSNTIVAGIVLIIRNLQYIINYLPLLVIEAICASIILIFAPIQSDAKKISNNEWQIYKKYIRYILISELVFALLTILILKSNKYGFIIIAAHATQAVSLLAVYLKKTKL